MLKQEHCVACRADSPRVTGDSIVHYQIQRDAIRQRVQELVMELQTPAPGARFDPMTAVLLQHQVMTELMPLR